MFLQYIKILVLSKKNCPDGAGKMKDVQNFLEKSVNLKLPG